MKNARFDIKMNAKHNKLINTAGGPLPNLLIIGVQKAGTSWLHRRLASQSKIFMSRKKELRYFTGTEDDFSQSRFDEYLANFSDSIPNDIVIGESTPRYFPNWNSENGHTAKHNIPQHIQTILGENVKLILILRHPVSRAISGLFHHFKMGRITNGEGIFSENSESFKSLQKGIVDIGYYHKHFEAWDKVFGEDKMLVLFHDDISSNSSKMLQDISRFLDLPIEVDDNFWNVIHKSGDFRIVNGALTFKNQSEWTKKRITSAKLKSGLKDIILPQVSETDVDRLNDLYFETVQYVLQRYPDRCRWNQKYKLTDYLL